MEDEGLKVVTYAVVCLLLIIIAAKFVLLHNGRKIRSDLFTFFWYSNYDIINSSSKNSERKRVIMNRLTLALIAVVFAGIMVMIYIIKDDL